MWTVLIAHHDTAFAEQLAAELRHAGYRVTDCPGPWPPAERCIRCDKGYCPLTESADLMIYDPRLTAVDPSGRRYSLAVDSARAHPLDAPNLHVAASTADARARRVRQLIAATHTAEVLL